ncbi:MAG: glycosyltransferase family 2 protein [Giesbergeria sp.]|uniref:glycosyltransferase family 2 protein n=1 Tax=Giesbergeria sp. TaxID=2818473 RepID=UPI002608B6DD|nr:glycosyltransferase family 2 protein [Giesbergeria sp.]MDD2608144.1 glycosyltransferase family 2 protein [Giesbergeria sp.]
MLITGITCVRNEADIIESFVRHNLNYLDHLLVVDNCSTDKTLEILLLLKNEGLNIDIKTFPAKDHQQEIIFNAAINQLAIDERNFDFCVLLDADEFIDAESKNYFSNELAMCPAGFYPGIGWKTYMPNFEAVNKDLNITTHMTHRRDPEGVVHYKSIVPKDLFGDCQVWAGNHRIQSILGGQWEIYPIKSKLAHIPIRSKEQAIAKLLLNSHSIALKSNKLSGEALHWIYLSNEIRSNGYDLSKEEIIKFSLIYGQDPSSLDEFKIAFDPIKIIGNQELKYQHLANLSTIERLDKYISQLIEEIIFIRQKHK